MKLSSTLRRPFLSLVVSFGLFSVVVLQNEATAQNQDDSKAEITEKSQSGSEAKPKAELNEKLKAAIGLGEIEVKLKPMVPSEERQGLLWAPKAGRVKLSQTDKGLSGSLSLAENESLKLMLEFEDPEPVGSIAHLKIDLNGDSKFEDGEVHKLKLTERRNKLWCMSPDVTIALKAASGKTTDQTRPYSIALWYVVDTNEPDKQPDIRWTRKGWHQGSFKLGDKTCTAVLGDFDLDGSFADGDTWGIGKNPRDACVPRNSVYKVNKHAWFDSVTYQITCVDKNGASFTIRAVDVGMTQAEEKAQADPYAKDRKYPRSEKPVVFMDNHDGSTCLHSEASFRKNFRCHLAQARRR